MKNENEKFSNYDIDLVFNHINRKELLKMTLDDVSFFSINISSSLLLR